MNTVLLSDLFKRTRLALKTFEYKESVLKRYEIEFRTIEGYFSNYGNDAHFEVILDGYMENAKYDYSQKRISKTKYYRIRRATDKLLQCYKHGAIEWRRLPNLNADTKQDCNDISGIINTYNYFLDKKGFGYNTKKNYLRISKLFMVYTTNKGKCISLDKVSREDVSGFIPYISQWYKLGSMSVVLTALRSFFRFVKEYNYCGWDMAIALPQKAAVKTIVYQPFTIEEESVLLNSISRSTLVGKRDYALILLIMRTGLRSVDIVNLVIDDIDWRRNTITIIQKKTQIALIIPLLPEVGNAIVDYLLHGRPASNDTHVFLRCYSPYIGFQDPYSCSEIVKKYIEKAGLRHSRNCAHSLRHSLASRLLENETPLTIISSILGHSNKESTREYLSTDLEQLRNCSLTLEGIKITQGALA
ncbi:site-specific integrase [Sporosarcina sp. BP05]|uniref:site-specific integrase n=1 Tax=Sporosarcina sp. BP05 TaxID=2758726 RepID=UPI001645C275|nr:site-specific integrase [Sporosarcina sp. BP05]